MLNLKELEEKLDAALAQETSESLTAWLLSKRMPVKNLGQGNLEKLPTQAGYIPSVATKGLILESANQGNAGNYQYAMAA